jgi:PAS domain S-box-containing protein
MSAASAEGLDGMRGIVEQMLRRVAPERIMNDQRDRLPRAIVEQAPDAIIFADRDGIIRVWNARAEAVFGYAAAEAIGQSLDLIIPEHLRAAHWRGYREAIAAGRTRHGGKAMLTRATHKDGSRLSLEVAFGIVSGPHGVLGALATARPASKPSA